MRIKYFLALIFLILAACAPKPTISKNSDTGVEGIATIGPMCPVMRIDTPCPDKPFQATLTVFTTSQQKVTQLQTDANGHFKIELAPGNYILHPESKNIMPHANDIPFTVTAGAFTQVNISFDSGIR